MVRIFFLNVLIPVLIIGFYVCPVLAQNGDGKTNFLVKVDVSTYDESYKKNIESYVKRELRSLGDVTVSDTNNKYIIHIVCTNKKNSNGIITDYLFAVTLTELFTRSFLGQVIEIDLLPKASDRTNEVYQELIKYEEIFLFQWCVGSRDLKEACETIVVNIDEVFEAYRQALLKSQ